MKLSVHKKIKRGFSLVELIMVVAIITILAFIAAPKFSNMTENAKIATFENNHETAKAAIGMHLAKNQGIVPGLAGGAGIGTGKLGDDITKFIEGGELTGKPANSRYEWTGEKLVSVLTNLSDNAKTDINNSKRPGTLSSYVGDAAYVLEFCPVVTGSGDR